MDISTESDEFSSPESIGLAIDNEISNRIEAARLRRSVNISRRPALVRQDATVSAAQAKKPIDLTATEFSQSDSDGDEEVVNSCMGKSPVFYDDKFPKPKSPPSKVVM